MSEALVGYDNGLQSDWMRNLDYYLGIVNSIFEEPSPPDEQDKQEKQDEQEEATSTTNITSSPNSVGTQTQDRTELKPLLLPVTSVPITVNKLDTPMNLMTPIELTTPIKVITPIKVKNASTFTVPGKVNKATERLMNSKSVKNKGKQPKKVGTALATKKGRYDNATTKRSVSPVFDAAPSDPFQ